MTHGQQSIAALAVVALTAGWLLWRSFFRRSAGGCSGGGCPAISPEVKKFKARLNLDSAVAAPAPRSRERKPLDPLGALSLSKRRVDSAATAESRLKR